MSELARGTLKKMQSQLTAPVAYHLPVSDNLIDMNALLEQHVTIEYHGAIYCVHCNRKTNKSFSQGFCYPCFRTLAQCDSCIMSPEKCHYHEGTCREPEWGETHCMIDHIVYLANSSGVKIGITRHSQIPTRWIDQGAVQAMPLVRVKTRYQSGLFEHEMKGLLADKTHWQKMLKGGIEQIDLIAIKEEHREAIEYQIAQLQEQFGIDSAVLIDDAKITDITYPVLQYPTKVKSFNLEKTPIVEGQLMGIKGQYLILDTGVINMRKYTGYEVSIKV